MKRISMWILMVYVFSNPVLCDCVFAKPVKREDKRPNILFIFTDDQSHRTVSCYPEAHRWIKTPNLDRLADEGLRFSAAYPAGAWCLPSRATVLTGLHPHGIRGLKVRENPYSRYDPKVCRFWPVEFRKAGYRTGFIGKWHLSEDAGHGRDWDYSAVWNHAVPKKAGGYYKNQKLNFDGGPYRDVDGYSTDNYTRYAEQFIRRDHDKPWFLWLCYGAVHGPYTPAERHLDRYNNVPVSVPLDIYPPRPDKPTYMHELCWWEPGMGPQAGQPVRNKRTLAEWVRQYNRAVSAVDEGVGRLMEVLEETGQLDNTFIVFTSDQGLAWGQHGFAWKVAPYDANLRVPLMIRMPSRVAKGKVCRHPVGTLDVVATFFALSGISPPWKMHGHDLTPILKSPDASWPHPVLLEHTRWEMGYQTDRGVTRDADFLGVPWWIFLRQGRYKYIRTLLPNEIEELYDLQQDPEELKNLALKPAYHQTLADYRQRMVAELKRTDAALVKNLPEPRMVNSAPLPSDKSKGKTRNSGIYYSVRQYGAVGDGKTIDTPAIQKAVDAAAAAGGGTVYLSAGTYLTGTIVLKNNVTLKLDAGATILGSIDIKDYPSHRNLIYAENVHHVAITGRGTIVGQGDRAKGYHQSESDNKQVLRAARERGMMLRFARCRNIRIEGVTLRNSPSWMQHYVECENLVIDGITVHNHCNHFNDGMDIDNCCHVHISNCRVTSGDDAIVLKSKTGSICENVTITNCIVSSHSNGIKFGTESHGGFRNIAISNCAVLPVDPAEPQFNGSRSGLAGIALETVDGATLEQVAVSNITIRGTVAPIFVRLGNRGRKLRPDMDTPPVGKLRHITINNVVAVGASSVGCGIVGLPGHRIEDLTLSDISITFGTGVELINYGKVAPGGTLEDVYREIPEMPDAYPECNMFGKLPAYGFYARHVEGLTFRNLRLKWTEYDRRPALFCEDVRDLSVGGLRAESTKDAAPVIILNNVQTALIRGCIAATGTNRFLGLQGETKAVGVVGNDLSRAQTAFDFAPGTSRTALYESNNRMPGQ
ncbi:MAG: sulfatase-like hydrolase/transferase [Planctomycetota bacterium]|nr:MAG: sulfatase-like hydrolase/transferase [Planctomycetota bacterium]